MLRGMSTQTPAKKFWCTNYRGIVRGIPEEAASRMAAEEGLP